MDRRNFLSWMGVGALASSLPIAITACNQTPLPTTQSPEPLPSPPSPSPAESPAMATPEPIPSGFEPVGTVAQLDGEGAIAAKLPNATEVIVIRDAQDAKKVKAFNARCTHEGCTVAWSQPDSAFVCPCHGAIFSPTGEVTNGPAKAPLASIEALLAGDEVLVKS